MALKPSTIRTLFGDLVPYIDDVKRTIVIPKRDPVEVARDMSRIIDNVDLDALPVQNAGNVLKKALAINPTIMPSTLIDIDPEAIRHKRRFWAFHRRALPHDPSLLDTTTALGDNVIFEGSRYFQPTPHPRNISIPEMPLSQLVVNNRQVRPHKNTALGRWYERVKNDPRKQIVYPYPIGPGLPMSDDDLPF